MKKYLTAGLLLLALSFFSSWMALAQKQESSAEVMQAIAPNYPPVAVAANSSGEVLVEVKIDGTGKVLAATSSGPELLRKESERCAKQWTFSVAEAKESIRIATLSFIFKILPISAEAGSAGVSFNPPYGVEIRRFQMIAEPNSDPPPTRPIRKKKRKH